MTNEPNDPPPSDVNAALLGTPVVQSRRHQGKSREEYLRERAGRDTRTAMDLSGINRLRYRRYALLAVAVAALLAVAGGLAVVFMRS